MRLCNSCIDDTFLRDILAFRDHGVKVVMHDRCPYVDGRCDCFSFAAAPNVFTGRATLSSKDQMVEVIYVNDQVTLKIGATKTIHTTSKDAVAFVQRLL